MAVCRHVSVGTKPRSCVRTAGELSSQPSDSCMMSPVYPLKGSLLLIKKKIILYTKHSKTECIGWGYLSKLGTKSTRPSYLPDLKRQVFIDVRCSYPPTQGSFPESFLKKIFSVPFPSADSSVHRRSPLNGPPLFPEAKSAVSKWRLWASQELSLGSGSLTHTAFCSFAGLNFRRSRFAITWVGSLLWAFESVLFRGEPLFWGHALMYA